MDACTDVDAYNPKHIFLIPNLTTNVVTKHKFHNVCYSPSINAVEQMTVVKARIAFPSTSSTLLCKVNKFQNMYHIINKSAGFLS